MKTRIRLLTIVLIAAAVAAPGVASASHAWGNYHWERSSNPVELKIGDNVSSVWDGHLDTAITDWNDSKVLSLTEVPGKGGRRCKAQSGRIEVCTGFYGNNGWLGIASISVSGDHITAATAKMNDTYFSSGAYNTPAWRQMVMCQEIGHAFGLGHQDENFYNEALGTCMDYTSDPEPEVNQHPDGHDYAQLEAIYAHLDSDSGSTDGGTGGAPCPGRKKSCRQGNNGVAGSDLVGPGEWGQLVREEGRHAIYERDFGSGNRVVTFVTWAD